jgi:ArsR family transcriptional regulator
VPHQPLHRFKAEFFRALGHPARLRILELLRARERNVSELQVELGIEASSVSQQLAVLRAKNIVDTHRVGTNVYYAVRDPQVFQLLDVARDIFNNHLIDLQAMLATQDRGEVAAVAVDGRNRSRNAKPIAATRRITS